MSAYLADVPRHAFFGTEADPNKLYIVPEHEVHVELIREANRTKVVAKFKGQSVTLPLGSAVQYIQLQAITASGGIGFPEAAPDATVTKLDLTGKIRQ